MKQRCLNPSNAAFKNYGGRGITICQEWLNDFSAFYHDMGTCPPGLTLDRRDNDGPYSKQNCQWASRSTQSKNRRPYKLVQHFGNRHHNAKLTEGQAAEILARFNAGEKQFALAREFGVTDGVIDAIRKGKTWSRSLHGRNS